MLRNRLVVFFSVFFAGIFFWIDQALAWGPAVHTAIALNTLDCAKFLLPSMAGIITAFPIEYMYGSLSADFFIGKGRKKRIVENPHTWDGGFKLLAGVKDEREASYALGFLSHLAADVIAHNFFIPKLLSTYPGKGKMGHLFWEVRSDYLIGSGYTKIARGVLCMDHQICDDLLKLVAGKRQRGLKTGKQFFANTVKVSDYLYSKRDLFFEPKANRWRLFHQYLATMVELSCNLSNDFLKSPEATPSLHYDPMGRQNLILAKGKRTLSNSFRKPRNITQFQVDEELLSL
jgi:hypothetical protein